MSYPTLIFSTGSIHPGAMNHRSFKRTPLSSKKSLSRLSPTSPFCGAHSCELHLLSILQGAQTTCTERVRLTEEIQMMSNTEKRDLLCFIQSENGAACCAIENNACKEFGCTSAQFSETFCEDECVHKMMHLWERLFNEIIPNVESILFPLAKFDESFDIRRVVLRFFRDRVLSRCLHPIDYRIPELEPILFTVLFETEDGTIEYENFTQISNRLMGSGDVPPNISSFGSFRSSLRKSSSMALCKGRSRTLPNQNKRKSVQWQDLRKSKTVSQF